MPTLMGGRHGDWRDLGDRELERLLVERWLYRGLLLGVVFLAAVGATLVGAQGLTGLRQQVATGILLTLALVVGAVALAMRQRDLAIHRELRRRRRAPAEVDRPIAGPERQRPESSAQASDRPRPGPDGPPPPPRY